VGKGKVGRPGLDAKERATQAAIRRAINDVEGKKRTKILQDMAKYRKNHKRMASKQRAARAAGLSYGYYVALVLEGHGRLAF
jgi:hypothetical protein